MIDMKILILFALVACASAVTWESCPLLTRSLELPPLPQRVQRSRMLNLELPIPDLREFNVNLRSTNVDAECAMFIMPGIHGDNYYDAQVPVFVKRWSPRGWYTNATRSMMLLQGGPGGSIESMEMIAYIMALSGDTDNIVFYMMEHRGVGRSTRLGCDGPQAETPGSEGGISITAHELYGCTAYHNRKANGDRRYHSMWSVTQAAHDLHDVVQYMKEQHGDSVTTYGVSYGTMLVHRYMQLHPEHSKQIVLDGIVCTAGPYGTRLTFPWWDRRMPQVLGDVLSYCKNDTFCNSKLKLDRYAHPIDKVAELMNELKNGKCSQLGIDMASYKMAFSMLMYNKDERTVLFALIYRLSRCNSDDVQVLTHFRDVMGSDDGCPACQGLSSDQLYDYIAGSELVDYAPDHVDTAEELTRYYEEGLIGVNITDSIYNRVHAEFPRYERDEYFNHTADAGNSHVLMMNGDGDPQTSIYSAYPQYQHMHDLSPDHVHWLFAPVTVHGVIYNSAKAPGEFLPCGMMSILSFVNRANGTYFKHCDYVTEWFNAEKVKPEILVGYFNAKDLYEGGVIVEPTPKPEPTPTPKDDDKGHYQMLMWVFASVSCALLATTAFLFVNSRKLKPSNDSALSAMAGTPYVAVA